MLLLLNSRKQKANSGQYDKHSPQFGVMYTYGSLLEVQNLFVYNLTSATLWQQFRKCLVFTFCSGNIEVVGLLTVRKRKSDLDTEKDIVNLADENIHFG